MKVEQDESGAVGTRFLQERVAVALPWIVTAIAAIAATVFAAAFPLFATDTAARYAPMAEAFAAGNWAEAFHPRFCVGLSVLSGIVCFATGLDGYAACSAVSTLAWALGAPCLFAIASSVFDRRTAWFAFILYLICPQTVLWGLKGFRESFKLLGFLLMALALLRHASHPRQSIFAACAGVALLLLFKCDAILPGAVFSFAYAVLDRFRRRTWILAAVAFAALQPACALVWKWTGVWLPAPHYVAIFGLS